MKNNDFEIDFVIPWVDGSDPEWIKLFNQFAPDAIKKDVDISDERFRDYGTLKYWFRGVEKFAPWVRKIHFITNGQKPEWLNLDNQKLHWVKHSDYIPKEYLPIFSSHPIELYMHKIEGLAEHFVYFNDDVFLTDSVKKTFFFKNKIPCDCAILNALTVGSTIHVDVNNYAVINQFFDKKSVIKKNFFKWINLKYGISLIRTLCLTPWPRFTGFLIPHTAQAFIKSTLEEVWQASPKVLEQTMNQKFRSVTDVNQWLFRFWNLCKGNFYPINPYKNKGYFELKNDIQNNQKLFDAIKKQKYKEFVINDSALTNPKEILTELCNAFDSILPEKSSFEK